MGRFISTASSGAAQTGEIKEFSSGVVPDGYLALDGSCVCKTTYQDLYNFVGNLEPPLYCASDLNYPPVLCGYTVIGGSCYCFSGSASTSLSSWGSDCVVLYQVQIACCCCTTPGNGPCAGLLLICYNTGDCCGVICGSTANPRCTGGGCLCFQACQIYGVYSFYQNDTRYIGVNTYQACSCCNQTYVFNFDQKCFLCNYCIQSCCFSTICNSSVHRINPNSCCHCVAKVTLPTTLTASTLCVCPYTLCSVGFNWVSFYPQNSYVGYESNFCCGREPAYYIGFGCAFCCTYGSNCSLCGIMGINFQTSRATIATCCWFGSSNSIPITCCTNLSPVCGSWDVTGPVLTPGKWCNPNSAVFTQVATWRLCVYQGASTFFNNWRYSCTVAISVGSGTGNIITSTAVCPVQPACTGGSICSGISKLFWNEKCNTFFGTSTFVNCTPTCAGFAAIYTGWDFEYNTTTKLPPMNHCATTYATTILCPTDVQGYYSGGSPVRYDAGKIAIYGFSTVSPTSPVFLLPSAPHPIPNIKYYIKT